MAAESPWNVAARELVRARKRAEPRRIGVRRPREDHPAPRLRLVGGPATRPTADAPAITDAADPRWVLAIRTADQLEGSVLSPERRERLLRLGSLLGLSVFDANLVIAIVQNQARRGHRPEECPARGESQLRMVPLPIPPGVWGHLRHNPLRVAAIVAAVLGIELLLWMLWSA